jgi:hypothetical protein
MALDMLSPWVAHDAPWAMDQQRHHDAERDFEGGYRNAPVSAEREAFREPGATSRRPALPEMVSMPPRITT